MDTVEEIKLGKTSFEGKHWWHVIDYTSNARSSIHLSFITIKYIIFNLSYLIKRTWIKRKSDMETRVVWARTRD